MDIRIYYDRSRPAAQDAAVVLPGSKSMAARILVLDCVNGYAGERMDLPCCDDTRELAAALRMLGRNVAGQKYYLGSGAASLRFFTALAASVDGFDGVVDCSGQLRRRPLSPLVTALRGMGADVRYMEREGYPPLYIKGKKLDGGAVEIDGGVSSQFISALLLVSSLWTRPLELRVTNGIVSEPYVEMTRRMIEMDGVCGIEPDWSAAAFFYELALLCPGRTVEIERLAAPGVSLQGDAESAGIFHALGVGTRVTSSGSVVLKGDPSVIGRMAGLGRPIELDLGRMPDLVPALTVGMALAGIEFRFVNIGHLRHKESDRIAALQTEMGKIGFGLESGSDWMSWTGSRLPVGEDKTVDSHDDHRIAMAFAPAAAKLDNIGIRGVGCVAKSFPGFMSELGKVGFTFR